MNEDLPLSSAGQYIAIFVFYKGTFPGYGQAQDMG